jgi:hypothetical protein
MNSSIEMTEPDIYGQCHPMETDELIQAKLKEFEAELLTLTTTQTASLAMAQEKCPELLDTDFKVMFLRCEVFNVKVSREWNEIEWKEAKVK